MAYTLMFSCPYVGIPDTYLPSWLILWNLVWTTCH